MMLSVIKFIIKFCCLIYSRVAVKIEFIQQRPYVDKPMYITSDILIFEQEMHIGNICKDDDFI